MNVSPYYICAYENQDASQVRRTQGCPQFSIRYGKVVEQRAVNRFLTAKSLTPHSKLSLSSRYGHVIVRVLSADEIKEKQKQGRQIAVLGKMEDVTPRMAFAQARKVTATGELPQIPIPTFTPFPRIAAAAAGTMFGGGLLAALGHEVAHRVLRPDATPQEKELYATVEILKKYLAELEAKVETYIETNHNNGGDGTPPFGIFNPIIDENRLADCFYEIHSHFFGADAKDMLLNDCDDERFAAYLFVLVEKEGLGCENFSSKSQTDFHQYIKTKVLPSGAMKTLKTFNNRLQSIKNLRPSEAQGDQPSPTDFDSLNFQKITKFFQDTHYYYLLSKLKKGR